MCSEGNKLYGLEEGIIKGRKLYDDMTNLERIKIELPDERLESGVAKILWKDFQFEPFGFFNFKSRSIFANEKCDVLT